MGAGTGSLHLLVRARMGTFPLVQKLRSALLDPGKPLTATCRSRTVPANLAAPGNLHFLCFSKTEKSGGRYFSPWCLPVPGQTELGGMPQRPRDPHCLHNSRPGLCIYFLVGCLPQKQRRCKKEQLVLKMGKKEKKMWKTHFILKHLRGLTPPGFCFDWPCREVALSVDLKKKKKPPMVFFSKYMIALG